jgi:hypothetical protein
MDTNGTNGNSKLDALLKREESLKSAIAAEKVRQQKRREKENARLYAIVGEICVRDGEESPEYKAMLIRVMQAAEIPSADRSFLVRKGWL